MIVTINLSEREVNLLLKAVDDERKPTKENAAQDIHTLIEIAGEMLE